MKIMLFSNDLRYESFVRSILPKSEYVVEKCSKITQLEILQEVKLFQADLCIFHSSYTIPDISRVVEKLIYLYMMNIIYVSSLGDIGRFYNVMDNPYFLFLDEDKIVALEDIMVMMKKFNQKIELLEKRLNESEEKLNDGILINKAKAYLYKKGFSEEEAYKYIQKRAMDKRIPKAAVAKEIIRGDLK